MPSTRRSSSSRKVNGQLDGEAVSNAPKVDPSPKKQRKEIKTETAIRTSKREAKDVSSSSDALKVEDSDLDGEDASAASAAVLTPEVAVSAKKRKGRRTPSASTPSKDDASISKKMNGQFDGEEASATSVATTTLPKASLSPKKRRNETESDDEPTARFIGSPVSDAEARQRWPKRYISKKKNYREKSSEQNDSDEIVLARRHYVEAEVDGTTVYKLYDDAHVQAEEGADPFICKIVEMFEGVDGKLYFTAQWYYRARDTVVKDHANLIDSRRVFFSEVRDDNPLDCLVKKLNIAKLPLTGSLEKKQVLSSCDFYCDMLYLLPYSSFLKLPEDMIKSASDTSSTISSEVDMACEVNSQNGDVGHTQSSKPEVTLLDLYSGCGAMSTGLCLGAQLSDLNLVTKWAVDLNEHACASLKFNHLETEVRNEAAEDFLRLLREWEKLCICFSLIRSNDPQPYSDMFEDDINESDGEHADAGDDDGEVFEVENILAICYGDPRESGKRGLYLKVHWKGYGADADSWEPIEGLSNCKERIREYVTNGYKSKILPLPGTVDVICGGPPCQGISGFNRFRNKENPLQDEKNKQLIVYMDLVEYLKPQFVLMENVVDIVKFANGYLGRYAFGRLIGMNYQVRMGMMAAGAYGLPQFRMRVFMWGAQPQVKLPSYPLPTHDVVVRGVIPTEWENNTVAYNEGHSVELESKLLLEHAISDLPHVGNYEHRDEMPYGEAPKTEFQRFIRLRKEEALGSPPKSTPTENLLFDHRPLELNSDDYQRVCRIPQRKGANFRDLPGVHVRADNRVEWDPDVPRVYLDSGKPLVPDYAMTFVNGSSSKPFARLWWDEIVPTVVTRAEPHNQAILHPEQDRVLTIRENARIQGFPDYYKLHGSIKERYIQVGNAVAVPVARALGYALGQAFKGTATHEPIFRLPSKFPHIPENQSPASSENDA